MPNLFDALRSSVNALHAASEGIAIAQLNMTNAGVPGYAKRNISQAADAFDVSRGQAGGVQSNSTSARSLYAEQAVWSLTSQKGFLTSLTQSSNGVDGVLGAAGATGDAGMLGSLSGMFQGFNKLRQGPTERINQEEVVERARGFALTLSQTADFLAQSGGMAQSRAQTAVSQINGLVRGIQQWNSEVGSGSEPDAASEAKLYASIEKLASLVPITVQRDPNGSMTILLNGRTPLLQGSTFSPLSIAFQPPDSGAPFPDADAQIRILDSAGDDVTDAVDAGELGGVIEYLNTSLPKLLGDASQQGDLNRLAQGVADAVNGALGGTVPVFLYDTNPTDAARTLTLNPDFGSAELVAAVNANPTALANLTEIAQGATAANQIAGQSFTQFFVSMSTRAATESSSMESSLSLRSGLVEQAKSFRETVQGASVEESAVQLLEYQRAFEAAAKVIGVIDELTKTTMDMLR
jgi:flagellar hook-associated protein 1 FlgK